MATKVGSVRSPSKPSPGLDIFRTPENPTFYSANMYESLDTSKREFRLIKLSTQTGGGILECKLLPAMPLIDAQKRYLALSYCAGDPTDTKDILVNGVKCNIFANLHHALVLARRYWIRSSRQSPLLWIDQLCINQHDLKERSHQVGFMREIYQCAERTLACLSTTKTSGRGLKWLIDLCDAVPSREDDEAFQYDREEESDTEHETDSKDASRKSKETSNTFNSERAGGDRQQLFRISDHLWNNMHIEKFINGWIAFYDVLTSPWWNRVWICQEFLVSSQVSFMFGHHFVSWELCWKTMQAFCRIHRYTLMNRDHFLGLNGLSVGCPEDRQLCRILNIVQERDLNRQVGHVGMALKMKIRWSGSMNINALLSHSRSCKSSDDRDRVYAILGLASPGYQIFPDYSHDMSASEVMITTTKAIIEKEDSLRILIEATTLVRSKNLDLPSWVVDWTSTEASDIRNNHFGNRFFHHNSCIPHESPESTFETVKNKIHQTQAHLLRVYGTFITKIWLVEKGPFAAFYGAQGWQGSALVSITDGDEVWILYGLRVPMVLRPYRDGYQVVSSACLMGQNGEGFGTPLISTEVGRANKSRIVLY
ncbi:heterokaryon incompatibility protein-domain-containing protein [Fusarium redolens]|uniref:Heterokaryon incompatibility protein-domain-containing protein n=1 Tax=Fusarium redolens TaxID=48865 RepID=A0A9P9H459_FUSRE|nr:heterokaryon incompatibility protein-domain-containing protein [Fusarium redolens]KAH7250326.1 heterokaryon incompatibility protein-domain-containing protein [Fusarium redolens]